MSLNIFIYRRDKKFFAWHQAAGEEVVKFLSRSWGATGVDWLNILSTWRHFLITLFALFRTQRYTIFPPSFYLIFVFRLMRVVGFLKCALTHKARLAIMDKGETPRHKSRGRSRGRSINDNGWGRAGPRTKQLLSFFFLLHIFFVVVAVELFVRLPFLTNSARFLCLLLQRADRGGGGGGETK